MRVGVIGVFKVESPGVSVHLLDEVFDGLVTGPPVLIRLGLILGGHFVEVLTEVLRQAGRCIVT